MAVHSGEREQRAEQERTPAGSPHNVGRRGDQGQERRGQREKPQKGGGAGEERAGEPRPHMGS